MRSLKIALLCGALALAAPALAQTTYPTAAGTTVKVAGTVPLQCNASGQMCAPVTAANPMQVTVGGGSPTQVVGNVASGAADSGNPVKTGGVFNTTQPTLTTGQRGDTQMTSFGATLVMVQSRAGQELNITTPGADAGSASSGLWTNGQPYVFNGTTWDRQRGDANGLVVQSGLSSTLWTYASGTAGILSNTTAAVTFKAAAGASVRNYIDSCQINTTAFGAASPLAIRDGAGGTVIFALNVPAAGFLNPVSIVFQTPLRSTANTLLEVVTTTANVTGTAYVNCQGHTGS